MLHTDDEQQILRISRPVGSFFFKCKKAFFDSRLRLSRLIISRWIKTCKEEFLTILPQQKTSYPLRKVNMANMLTQNSHHTGAMCVSIWWTNSHSPFSSVFGPHWPLRKLSSSLASLLCYRHLALTVSVCCVMLSRRLQLVFRAFQLNWKKSLSL